MSARGIFTIEWHPFQLNPEMPREGMDREAYLVAKFGSRARYMAMHGAMVEQADRAGVALNLDKVARTPNTLDAHRLIHWAGLEGRQGAVVTALFTALWCDGRDVGDRDVLADIAGETGLDAALIARALAGDGDSDEIRARDAHARERGVSGVPTFVIANRHVLQGAQPAEVWLQVIDDLSAQIAAARTA
jgi:predicted DsbA family dithiol-disulfide isomerase